MFAIMSVRWLSEGIKRLDVVAPRVARKWQAGQFVIVRVHDHGERIPLTVVETDPESDRITLIVQSVGKTTRLLNQLQAGDQLRDVVGPLGCPTHVERFGHVVVIGGGVGTAIALPVARAMKQAGNFVSTVIGARTRSLLILEDAFRATSDACTVMTDDGTYGQPGRVTDALAKILSARPPVDRVLAIGPIPMMRGVAEVTRPAGIPTIVSLNAIMVDGTGMCGGCRVTVGGTPRFACVEGPDFDAHLVNFAALQLRNTMYREAERAALERFERQPQRDLDRVREACQLAQSCDDVTRLFEDTGAR